MTGVVVVEPAELERMVTRAVAAALAQTLPRLAQTPPTPDRFLSIDEARRIARCRRSEIILGIRAGHLRQHGQANAAGRRPSALLEESQVLAWVRAGRPCE